MIVTETVLIRMGGRFISHYLNKGYKCKVKETIEVSIKDVLCGSSIKIIVRCDVCNFEKEISYGKYNNNVNRSGFYSCGGKCANIKYKNTCVEKYGVDSYTKTKECHSKKIDTNLVKYGVKYAIQNIYIKSKMMETISLIDFNKKENKKINTCIKKYGVKYASQSKLIIDKMKITNLEKYGYDFTFQCSEIKNKIKETKINNGNQISDDLLTDFKKYRKYVESKTRIVKTKLYSDWNGYDYYDNEYIKCNLNLDSSCGIYPTIDHKMSIYYGFTNNISVEEISNIDNLCITKRKLNSKKNKNNFLS